MRFAKMHGIGNDFILIDGFHNHIPDPAALARRLCNRRFGIGADGLILMLPSDRADAFMRIINSDGSEPEMCGNGIRCAARFLYENGLCEKRSMAIDTLAGIKYVQLRSDGLRVTVDMGAPDFHPERIPVSGSSNRIHLELDGRKLNFFCVSMGNPHAVTFDLYPDNDEFQILGPHLEHHPAFPAGANIEFCRVNNMNSVDVKVWERGCGPTLACGTGSCAVLAAGASLGLLSRSAEVHLPGGTLHDGWREDGRIFMTGPAEVICTGKFEL